MSDTIAHESLPQHLNDRNATRHAAFVVKIRSVLLGSSEQFLTMCREECLVRRDDRLAKLQRRQNHLARDGCATSQFGDDLNLRVADKALPIQRDLRVRD